MSVLKKVWMVNLARKSTNERGTIYAVDVVFDQYTVPYTVMISANTSLPIVMDSAVCEEPGLLEHVRAELFKGYFRNNFEDVVHGMVKYCTRQMIAQGCKRNSFSL